MYSKILVEVAWKDWVDSTFAEAVRISKGPRFKPRNVSVSLDIAPGSPFVAPRIASSMALIASCPPTTFV